MDVFTCVNLHEPCNIYFSGVISLINGKQKCAGGVVPEHANVPEHISKCI